MVYLVLTVFKYDENQSMLTMRGVSRFEDLLPSTVREQKQWESNRQEAYYGSMNHFMRALVNHSLKEEGFITQRIYKAKNLKKPLSLIDSLEVQSIKGNELFVENSNKVAYNGELLITFIREPEEPKYAEEHRVKTKGSQKSKIKFSKDVVVYPNGYYEDLESIVMEGYLSWSTKMAELLPYNYVPIYSKK